MVSGMTQRIHGVRFDVDKLPGRAIWYERPCVLDQRWTGGRPAMGVAIGRLMHGSSMTIQDSLFCGAGNAKLLDGIREKVLRI